MMIRMRDDQRKRWIFIMILYIMITLITYVTSAQIPWNTSKNERQEAASMMDEGVTFHGGTTYDGGRRHSQIYSHHGSDTSGDHDGDYDVDDYNHLLPSEFENKNFILTDYLTDGELERRISYNSITAKEISIGHNSSNVLSLWQVTDGKEFIQLIYSNARDLIDCEYVHQKGLVRKFLHTFYTEIAAARPMNFTLRNPSGTIGSYYHRRRQNHGQQINDKFDEMTMIPVNYSYDDDDDNNDAFGMRNLSYQAIERYEDIPEGIRQWLNYNDLKLQCRKRHLQMKEIIKGLSSQNEDVRRDANQLIQRKKRDLSDWLIAPNTKWCGRGHNAGKYNQLGGASTADKCCRKHDHCKLNIPGLTTKWQVFNYFPFTVSHCSCDMRFRTCLKMADSADANMVGKLFFNIVQTKCFVLKTEKVCKKRSWWGKCEKRVKRKRAHLRDNRKF